MNERKFLREIKQKGNEDGEFTPSIVDELLQQGRGLQIAKKDNIFVRLLKVKTTKTTRQIIEDNIEFILERTANNQLVGLINVLMYADETADVVKEKFDVIIKRFQEKRTTADDIIVLNYAEHEFLEKFKTSKSLLIDYMDVILQGEITVEDIEILKGLSAETDEKLNAKLESQKQIIARKMLEGISLSGRSEEERQKLIADYTPVITRMIEELLVDQNVRMIDIEQKGIGGYSKTYHIGEKVLKIGRPRETYKIPNHPRILQPLTRTNLLDERNGNKPFACIEISDRVDELSDEERHLEELYQVYKELREAGIIWTDAKYSNVGKLRSPNVPNLNGEKIDVDPVAVGMDQEAKETILQEGEWVILDTDFIYREGDSQIKKSYGDAVHSEDFERRWLQEKQGKVIVEYQKDEKGIDKEEYTKSYELRSWKKGKKREEEER